MSDSESRKRLAEEKLENHRRVGIKSDPFSYVHYHGSSGVPELCDALLEAEEEIERIKKIVETYHTEARSTPLPFQKDLTSVYLVQAIYDEVCGGEHDQS